MKKPVDRIAKKLPGLRIKCPLCGAVHKRGLWSVAHTHVGQRFICSCGQSLAIRADQ